MTGHRRRWIVRKNRAGRRRALDPWLAQPDWQRRMRLGFAKRMQAWAKSLFPDAGIVVEPYSMERISNVVWLDKSEIARRYEC